MLLESRWRRSALVLVASLLGAMTSSAIAGTDLPGQPYASYWFPSTILDLGSRDRSRCAVQSRHVSARDALLERRFQREPACASQRGPRASARRVRADVVQPVAGLGDDQLLRDELLAVHGSARVLGRLGRRRADPRAESDRDRRGASATACRCSATCTCRRPRSAARFSGCTISCSTTATAFSGRRQDDPGRASTTASTAGSSIRKRPAAMRSSRPTCRRCSSTSTRIRTCRSSGTTR